MKKCPFCAEEIQDAAIVCLAAVVAIVAGVFLSAQAARTVFLDTKNVWHRKDCAEIAGQTTTPMPETAVPSEARPCAVCKPYVSDAEWAKGKADKEAKERHEHDRMNLAYWAPPGTKILAAPSMDANVATTFNRQTVIQVFDTEPGWAHVRTMDDAIEGWLRADVAYLIPRTPGDTVFVVMYMKDLIKPNWPLATQLDVLHRRIRIGATKQMVTVALGDPIRASQEETAAAKTETLLYADRVLVLTNGKVTKIKTSEQL